MDYSKKLENFYKDNEINFMNDDELWKINEEIHILFTELKRITKYENDKLKKLYDKVFEYVDVSNKKNFKRAIEIGIYINQTSNVEDE